MDDPRPLERPPWHASATLLADYAALGLDLDRSASVEHHLLACVRCRTSLADMSRADARTAHALDELWLDVIDAVDRPRPTVVGRALGRLGVADRVFRIVSAAPSLRGAWIISILVVLAFAFASAARPEGDEALFLILAPLIPLGGIALAYGAQADPLHELMQAAPLPSSRIFLHRSLAVLLTAVPLTLLASLTPPLRSLEAMAWLLPALGLVAATMALSTWTQPLRAAVIAGGGWVTVVLGSWFRSARLDGSALTSAFVFRPPGQLLFALLALAGAAVFAARLGRLDQPDAMRREVF